MIFKVLLIVIVINLVQVISDDIEESESNEFWVPENTNSDLSHSKYDDESPENYVWPGGDIANSSSEFSESSESNDISIFKTRAIALKAYETSTTPPLNISTTSEITETTTDATTETTTESPIEPIKKLFKHIVQIKRKRSHFVTGTIIHSQWILTVAKEFYNIRESINEVKVYVDPECPNPEPIPVVHFILHPKYEINASNYDIALLRLAKPIENATKRTIKLHDWRCAPDDRPVYTVYWPNLTRRAMMNIKDIFIRKTTNGKKVDQIANEDCKDIIGPEIELDDSTLCFKPIRNGLAECTIDTGAPIIYNKKLWGVTSGWQHEGCLNKHMATLVTDVSLNVTRHWIRSTIKEFRSQRLSL